MTRETTLEMAKTMVCGHRESDYGSPEDSFTIIADLWSAYTGTPFTAKDVAAMMILLKVARIAGDRATLDSWVDIAGYAACGCEITTETAPMPEDDPDD